MKKCVEYEQQKMFNLYLLTLNTRQFQLLVFRIINHFVSIRFFQLNYVN